MRLFYLRDGDTTGFRFILQQYDSVESIRFYLNTYEYCPWGSNVIRDVHTALNYIKR